MPTFEFECQNCGHKFEKLVLGEEKVQCPKCKRTSLKKLISAPNVSTKSEASEKPRGGCSSCFGGNCSLCS
ncbi:MAG: zinc ribbon domain-containing protein [Candidatus Paceibacterota bacterium]